MSKISYSLISAFVLAFCLLSPGSAWSQETTGGIEGIVRDSAGAVVPNIVITVTSSKGTGASNTSTGISTGFRRVITTNTNGFFRLLQVPPGTYDLVSAPSSGFGETKYENVTVSIGQNVQLEITVSPGGEVNTVDVAASDTQLIDSSNSSIQTTVNAQKIELVPKSTGITGILKTVPGTRPESRTGGFSVDGSSGSENVFVIDGQEVTNYRTGSLNETYNIPTQLVQEVQVKSNGFEASYGGATGGVISMVTRGGNNEFHGEFGVQADPSKLRGTPQQLLTRFTTGTVAGGNFTQVAEYFAPNKTKG